MGTTNAVPGVSPRPKLPRKPKSKLAGTEAAKAQLSQVLENHVSHIKAHLERVREGHSIVNEPEKVYLGHTEGESFWEVLGLRLAGHPLPILAAFPFRRQQIPGIGHARESVAAYLSFPPATVRANVPQPRLGVLSAFLPRIHETIPEFLKGLRAGRTQAPTQIDPDQIEAAFDLRMHNPSALGTPPGDGRPAASIHVSNGSRPCVDGALSPGLVRVAQGSSDSLPCARPSSTRLAAKSRSARSSCTTGSLALATDISDSPARMAAANWAPFIPHSASAKNLLLG